MPNMPQIDIDNLDAVVRELDIEDSEITPAEAVIGLRLELEKQRDAYAALESEAQRNYQQLEAECGRLQSELDKAKSVIGWIESWVLQPAGSYSVYALDGLFGMTRDRIGALRPHQ